MLCVALAFNLSAHLPDFLLVFLQLRAAYAALLHQSVERVHVAGVRVQQVQHQLQAGPVQVHVQLILAHDKHDCGRAQGQTLSNGIK